MFALAIPLKDLAVFSDTEAFDQVPTAEIIDRVRRQFGFLGTDLTVELRDGIVFISRTEISARIADEAQELAERATRRARDGDYSKAIELFERALRLNPTMQPTWRDLAMAQMERGQFDAARDSLIDALRLDPRDAWSLVVLANIYAKQRNDFAKARQFYERALELKPEDPWALNGFAASLAELGDHREAARLFDRAIAADPTFANAWCGKALVLLRDRKAEEAAATLETMFGSGRTEDARTVPVFEEGRRLYAAAQAELARIGDSDAFKAVEDYRRTIERESGFPVKVDEGPLPGQIAASVQIAWKHRRDHHKVVLRKPPPQQQDTQTQHLLAHELTHIRLEAAARAAARNRFFVTTARTREVAIRALEPDLRRLQRRGYPAESIARVTQDLVQGVCGFLFNCPLDMVIERRLHAELPALRPAQFVSLARLAEEARQATFHEEIRKLTPARIWRANSALNGAFALFLDNLYRRATNHWAAYATLETAGLSQKLWTHWSARAGGSTPPGEEYALVDEFAEMLGLTGWYSWSPDTTAQHSPFAAEPVLEGSTNPDLLRAKHPAAVWFLLDALKRFAAMPPEQVRQIVVEIALLGREGLDYANPDQNYRLRALPGESFSGLHLMCLMFAGSKQVAPDLDTGMDLEAPFLSALELFNNEQRR